MSGPGVGRRGLLGAAAATVALALAAPAWGATWAGGRATPTLREIVALDKTGEPGWPYGAEDVAGDGATFGAPEQALDVRTGYAAVDAARLFLRAYLSTTAGAPGASVVVYVFIDSDGTPATGGKATAPEVDPRFTADPSPGGYEYVVGVRGDGTVAGVWQWSDLQMTYNQLAPATAAGEAGRDLDPLRVGQDQRGYVQASVDLAAVGVSSTCAANFFFRSSNAAPGAAVAGDLDVGARGSCVPADANADGVPDLVAPPPGCRDDDQCANQGACVEGRCVLAAPCAVTADCTDGRQCTPDGRCVVPGGGACTNNDPCDGAVCRGGVCAACALGGNECGAGRRCGPAGTCVEGAAGGGGAGGDGGEPGLAPGGQVEGGAFNCSGSAGGDSSAGAPFAALLLALAGAKRAARRRGDHPSN